MRPPITLPVRVEEQSNFSKIIDGDGVPVSLVLGREHRLRADFFAMAVNATHGGEHLRLYRERYPIGGEH